MKKILAIALLLTSIVAQAQQVRPSMPMERCAEHMPYGQLKSPRADTTPICREGYALEHDNKAKIPAWVSYTLTRERALGCSARGEKFVKDPSIDPDNSATTKDYAKSGYDIGHMANSADMRWSMQVSDESNVLSNAAPQLPNLNRGIWKSLETRTRAWAIMRDKLLIYVGPIYQRRGAATIGKGEVTVPTGFYKIIVDQTTNQVMAFYFPHEPDLQSGLDLYMTSLAEIQRLTGISFPMPKNAKVSERLWDVNANSVKSRAQACELK